MRATGQVEVIGISSDMKTVVVSGDHDLSSAPELRAALAGALECPDVVVDLAATTFVDSSILHVLIDADTELRRRNGDDGDAARGLVIRFGDAVAVRHVFEVAGLLGHFQQDAALDGQTC